MGYSNLDPTPYQLLAAYLAPRQLVQDHELDVQDRGLVRQMGG